MQLQKHLILINTISLRPTILLFWVQRKKKKTITGKLRGLNKIYKLNTGWNYVKFQNKGTQNYRFKTRWNKPQVLETSSQSSNCTVIINFTYKRGVWFSSMKCYCNITHNHCEISDGNIKWWQCNCLNLGLCLKNV